MKDEDLKVGREREMESGERIIEEISLSKAGKRERKERFPLNIYFLQQSLSFSLSLSLSLSLCLFLSPLFFK